MQKEKIVKFIIYFILSALILLFLMGILLPKKFDIVMSESEQFLTSLFATKGWVLLLLSLFTFLGFIKLCEFVISFFPKHMPFHNYKNDIFKDTHWKWKWSNEQIEQLWCYCPSCNQELSYKCDHLLFKTQLLCQKCEKQIATYDGDNINYVLSRVKSEIRRVVQRRLQENNK